MSYPNQPPGPPTVNVYQKRSSCGPILIVLIILFIIGSVAAVLFMGGCLAVFA